MKIKVLIAATLATALTAMECPASIQILLAGDSTMAEKLAEKRPETGWGEKLQDWFSASEVIVVNHAKNGRSTRTFIEEGRWDALIAEVNAGDYVFIQFGHNDASKSKTERYTSPEAFRANLERFVADVEKSAATPVLLTPVVRRRFDENGMFYDSHGSYPDLVREVAESTGSTLIDLHARSMASVEAYGPERSKSLYLWLEPGDSDNYPEGLEDNTHFTPLGARVMASLAMQGIAEKLPALGSHLGYLPGGIQQDADVAQADTGPHKGGGETIGHWFFRDSEDMNFVFRKRVMHPGSAIGYHLHTKDEIYYILEGNGELTLNGKKSIIGPGTAVFARPGDSHGLRAMDEDLVVIIVYEILKD